MQAFKRHLFTEYGQYTSHTETRYEERNGVSGYVNYRVYLPRQIPITGDTNGKWRPENGAACPRNLHALCLSNAGDYRFDRHHGGPYNYVVEAQGLINDAIMVRMNSFTRLP